MNPPETPHSLGAAIKARRHELGWSQEALAARMIARGDVVFRQSEVSRLERGKVRLPHRERLGHLAAVLGLSVGELLARSGWVGADAAFAPPARPTPGEDPRPVPPIADRAAAAPSTHLPRPVPTRSCPPQPAGVSRLREVLADARATRARTRQILAVCEQTRALYERHLGKVTTGGSPR
jgi:hypothetical protein